MSEASGTDKELSVAIIGAGVAGVCLALGLLSRGVVSVKLYERAPGFAEIGAGIGFSDNAERAMKALDPRIHEAFNRIRKQNGLDWFKWMDARKGEDDASRKPTVADPLITQLYLGERGFEGCIRAEFLNELAPLLPAGVVEFGHKLEAVVDRGEDKPLELHFAKQETVDADVVIGCDGLRSTVRQSVLGKNNPAAHPTYTHNYAFRGLIPMERAVAALGEAKSNTRHMYLGPNGHALTFPVAGGRLLNVVAFTLDPNDWPTPDTLTAPATREEAVRAFSEFNSTVRAIMELLPSDLDKWAIYDTFDHPAQTFSKGRMCLVGDAAHAAAPHHGAGAGFAIEDCLVLAEVLKLASHSGNGNDGKSKHLAAAATALDVYTNVRLDRALWLVETSRFVGRMYQWRVDEIAHDYYKRCAEEVEWRSHKIWNHATGDMVEQAAQDFKQRILANTSGAPL